MRTLRKKKPGLERGFFLVLEGLDGAGKSTQARRLIEALRARGLDPLYVKEPTDGSWGRKIRQIAQQGRAGLSPREELEYFVRDRAEDLERSILPALSAGRPVVADRYILSNLAYQSVLGLSEAEILEANKEFPWPDLTIILDISVEDGLARIAAGRDGGPNRGFEVAEYLIKVKAVFDRQDRPGLHRLDARAGEADLTESLLHLLIQKKLLPDPTVEIIDSHCHLSLGDFDQDLEAVLARARSAGVRTIVDVATNADSLTAALKKADRYPEVFAAAGCHPHEAAQLTETFLEAIARSFRHPKMVAVGETGLDYHYHPETKTTQLQAFETQLNLAVQLDRPVIVHSREASTDTVAVLKKYAGRAGGVIHCFTGSWEEAARYLDLGFYLSFPGVITFPQSRDLREAAARTPEDRLLVETDSPYIAPTPLRGRRNEPSFLVRHLTTLAEIRGLSLREIGAVTAANTRRLFRLPGL